MAVAIGFKDMLCVNMHKSIVGVVLAGGQSSRMGENKALMQYEGQTLLARAVSQLEASGLTQIYVSGSYVAYQSIPDSVSKKGPLSGIYSVLNHLSHILCNATHVICIPVDMPFLSCDILSDLMKNSEEDVDAIMYENFPLPIFLKRSDAVLSRLSEIFFNKLNINYSVKHFISVLNHQIKPIPVCNKSNFMNFNTREDWHQLTEALKVN